MKRNSFWQHCILTMALVWAVTSLAAGQCFVNAPIIQSFTNPANGATTTWTICWREVAGADSLHNPNGLVIGPVFFQKAGGAPNVDLIFDMRISEFFIPYHPGTPRFYDLSDFNFTLTALSNTDCPPGLGTLLSPNVCKEVHDRGLMWKDSNTGASYRGQELVLWGIIGAANYLYLEKYTFRDDGAILGSYLATGKNLPGSETVAHSHNVFWRIDMDLDGAANNSTAHLQHVEPFTMPTDATDTRTPILVEQGFPWNPQPHDALEISNSIFTNAQGNLSTYHLVAQPTGGVIHNTEAFTQNEFWVTPYDPGQFAARHLADTYIPQGRGIANADIVIWFHGSLHHHPRDEDGIFTAAGFTGVTDTMSTGFMLMPNNMFDCSPLYHAACP